MIISYPILSRQQFLFHKGGEYTLVQQDVHIHTVWYAGDSADAVFTAEIR